MTSDCNFFDFIQSVEVADAVYECIWYELPPKEAKLLIILIRRCRKPFDLTAGKFFVFSLQLFSSVCINVVIQKLIILILSSANLFCRL